MQFTGDQLTIDTPSEGVGELDFLNVGEFYLAKETKKRTFDKRPVDFIFVFVATKSFLK